MRLIGAGGNATVVSPPLALKRGPLLICALRAVGLRR
jgi:hypothetical protein